MCMQRRWSSIANYLLIFHQPNVERQFCRQFACAQAVPACLAAALNTAVVGIMLLQGYQSSQRPALSTWWDYLLLTIILVHVLVRSTAVLSFLMLPRASYEQLLIRDTLTSRVSEVVVHTCGIVLISKCNSTFSCGFQRMALAMTVIWAQLLLPLTRQLPIKLHLPVQLLQLGVSSVMLRSKQLCSFGAMHGAASSDAPVLLSIANGSGGVEQHTLTSAFPAMQDDLTPAFCLWFESRWNTCATSLPQLFAHLTDCISTIMGFLTIPIPFWLRPHPGTECTVTLCWLSLLCFLTTAVALWHMELRQRYCFWIGVHPSTQVVPCLEVLHTAASKVQVRVLWLVLVAAWWALCSLVHPA